MQDVARLPFVRVHIGRGQDTCISEQARRTRRTQTAGGVDSVKTVGRARGAAHAQDADGQWSRRCEDGGARQRCEDGDLCYQVCGDGTRDILSHGTTVR